MSPYNAFFSLHTRPVYFVPGGGSIYTSSSMVPFKKAFFTSNCLSDQFKLAASEIRTQMVFIFATGANVSS